MGTGNRKKHSSRFSISIKKETQERMGDGDGDWIRLHWFGLVWFGLDWIGLD